MKTRLLHLIVALAIMVSLFGAALVAAPHQTMAVDVGETSRGTTKPNPIKTSSAVRLLWDKDIGDWAHAIAIGDINNDSRNEVVAATGYLPAINVYAFRDNGNLFWKASPPVNGLADEVIITDIDGDNRKEVIVLSRDNVISVLNGLDGSVIRSIALGGISQSNACLSMLVCDLNNDGRKEIIAGSNNGIHVLNAVDGREIWSYGLGSLINRVGIGDIDGDGTVEVIAGSYGDSHVYALRGLDGSLIWRFFAQNPVQRIAVSDLDGDKAVDIAVGCRGGALYVLKGSTGSITWTATMGDWVLAINIADLDSDGRNEVIASFRGGCTQIFDAAHGDVLWTANASSCDAIVVGDINGDQKNELILGSRENAAFAFTSSGTELWRYVAGFWVVGIAIGDLNNDQVTDVVIGNRDGNHIYALGAAAPPTVTTDNATSIASNSATLNGTLTSKGTATTCNVSFQWGLTDNYTNETTPVSTNATGPFSATITGLSSNTTYHFRAKAVGDGTSYGSDKTFTTLLTGKPDLIISEKHEAWVNQAAGTYRVYYTVKNIGNASTNTTHSVSLAVDNVTLLEQKVVPVTLAPGATYSDNFSTNITLSGSFHTIIVRADVNNEVAELDEYNNVHTNTWWPSATVTGSISGHVYRSGGIPIGGAMVGVGYLATHQLYGAVPTNVDGSYTVAGLPSGQYVVRAEAVGYAGKYYNNTYIRDKATAVSVTAPNNIPGIDFTLTDPGAAIAGRVYQSDNVTPIAGALVLVYDYASLPSRWVVYGGTWTGADGSYATRRLRAGQYALRVTATGYATEWYNNIYEPLLAAPVSVAPPNDTLNINFSLDAGGTISGRVQSDNTTPIAGATVEAFEYASLSSNWVGYSGVQTGADGSYRIESLPAGQYGVRVRAAGYANKWYNNTSYKDAATPVPVTVPNDTSGINFSLGPGGSISGVIKNAAGSATLANVSVECGRTIETGGYYWEGAAADSQGNYTISGLPYGQYIVHAPGGGRWGAGDNNYVMEYYNNRASGREADLVTVASGVNPTNINFTLDVGGSISGRVCRSDNVTPIVNCHVYATDNATGEWMVGTFTNSQGNYTLSGLTTGSYLVRAVPAQTRLNYIHEWYNNTYYKNEATPVSVTVPNDTPNINFSLDPGGTISGVIRNADGSATLANISVDCRRTIDTGLHDWWHGATADSQGNYTIYGLPYGQYVVRAPAGGHWALGDDNYVLEYYNNRASGREADLVTVASGVNPTNINFTLDVGGSISGRVCRSDNVTPIVNCHVYATDNATGEWLSGANTDTQGNYTLRGLPAGSYRVRACATCSGLRYVDKYYNDVYTSEKATLVTVTPPGNTPGINFALENAVRRATVDAAIADGVAWLVSQQNPDGSWGTNYALAKTALAVLKLETLAKEQGKSPFDPTFPYRNNVEAGLNYIFTTANVTAISSQPAGYPDSNGNGTGVFFNQPDVKHGAGGLPIYNTSLALMAIAASGDSTRRVSVPGSAVNGGAYEVIAQDAVDYLAWAQTDSGYGRGGWNYQPMNNAGNRSDESNSGWVTLALAYAEAPPPKGLGLAIPGFVRTELDIWIDYIQNDVNGDPEDGGADYTGPLGDHALWVNILKTGNLLQQMAFRGDTTVTPRVQAAINYLVRHWYDWYDPGWWGHPICYHTTYTTMKGLEAFNIDTIDSINWYQDFTNALLGEQSAAGWWPVSRWDDGERILSTAWALLTLERARPPTREAPDLVVEEKYELWVPAVVGSPNPYMVLFTVKNRGNTPAPPGHDVRLIVDNVIMEEKPIPITLAPGATYSDSFATPITLSGAADNITVCADAYNEVAELNEDNNCRSNISPPVGADAPISLDPATTTVGVGGIFSVQIKTNVAASQAVSGVSAFINYDRNFLEVVDSDNITPGIQIARGTALPVVLQNMVDNATGQINYSAGKIGAPFPTGTFGVAKIVFRALVTTTNTTAVTFSFTGARTTIVDYGGTPLSGTHRDATVQITTGANVNISVALQGGLRPDSGWVVPVTVKFFTPGANVLSATPLHTFNLMTTKSGATATCNATGVPPATYDITIVSEHTLMSVRRNVVVTAPTTAVDMGTLLEGDANNDGIINISDFGILAVSFMKSAGQPGFDARADFDRSGIINISDFGLLAVNFLQTSPQTSPMEIMTRVYGTLTYNGVPLTQLTDRTVNIWVRDEDTGQVATIAGLTFNQSTSEYSFLAPPGRYGIHVSVDVDGNGWPWPGDFYKWVEFEVRQSSVRQDIDMLRIIHLTRPADNAQLVGHTDAPKPAYPQSQLVIRWDILPEAASYELWIDRYQESYQWLGTAINTTVSGTEYTPQLAISEEEQFYLLRIYAKDSQGKRVGMLMVKYENGHGWDYRFRVVP